jgi:hypothetical protein
MPLPPSFFVFSGHGLYPWWLFKEPWCFADAAEREKAARLMRNWQAAISRLGRERGWQIEGTADLARVLRLPGTANRKAAPVPVHVQLPAAVRRYDCQDLLDALAALPEAASLSQGPPRAARPVTDEDQALALQALRHLKPERAVGYADWLAVGMVLHATSDSEEMLGAWDEWSQQPEANYEPGACEAKWRTFHPGGGRALGSLLWWAQQDTGWSPPGQLDPPRLVLPAAAGGQAAAPGGGVLGLGVTPMSDLRPQPLEWLVPGYLPRGKLVLIAGDGGYGKSLLTLHIAARLSRGLLPFNQLVLRGGGPAEVLLCNCEDDFEDTVLPRLLAAGADLSRTFRVDGVLGPDGKLAPFGLAHCAAIEAELARRPGVRLIVVDPVSAYLGATDDHRDAELRGLLGPLAELAARRGVTVLLVKHLSKSNTMRAAHLVGGSVAWVNACRAVFAVAPDPDDEARRLLMPIKFNLGPKPQTLAYSLIGLTEAERAPILGGPACAHLDDEGRERLGAQLFRVAWEGPANVDADEVLSASRQREQAGPKVAEAADWLLEQLRGGPKPSAELIEAARQAGYSRRTLFRAKKELGKQVRAVKQADGWAWQLVEECQAPGTVAPGTVDTFGTVDVIPGPWGDRVEGETSPEECQECQECPVPGPQTADTLQTEAVAPGRPDTSDAPPPGAPGT